MIHFKTIIRFIVKEENHEVMLIKTLIMICILSAIFLPAQHSLWVSTVSNLIWLWRL